MSDRVRKRVIYRGRVQGVGFRATTHSIASGYAVAGFVRNLPDGTVELIAEGPADELRAFLDAIGRRMGDYIEGVEAEDISPGDDLQGFRIR